ncbi:hydroxyethylthiazole kinase [Alysiella filiformis]|uniref:Hydroxyethylthiazole kinase n=1 Tax=Alysiella filiformis DSM 16848 TaxID=1120981 RepID=A0A286EPA0_9NEIS|nr:hydroxyethylthiazole kinase [Alysiella filiformis]QMT32195.1 hydroxyethylthiazole kinase [Alysiella filiformis]UBQ56883.1 hydroxyethylthiazole kinase [Alysiella filiformis DSM 16848]SOD72604.1 hydroxyethylthiazole kinase [Alysiella filiformis DSM 16848]
MNFHYLNAVREHQPLIHNIANLVSAHFTANGLLALGATPMMAQSPAEMAELAAISGALVLNLGTPSDEKVAAMLVAGVAANRANVPVVLDPVAVAASTLRRETVAQFRENIAFSAIRGNAGEMAHLAGMVWQSKGVDAGSGESDVAQIAQTVSQKWQCVAVVSGAVDYVSDGVRVARLVNGVDFFARVTASGCLLSAVVGAFLAVAPREQAFEAVCEACTVYAVAGELAAKNLQNHQVGTFAWRLLDTLAGITSEQVQHMAKISML